MQTAAATGGDAPESARRRVTNYGDARALPSVCTRSISGGSRPGSGRAPGDCREKMTTLDGVERTLHVDDLLICDAERNAAGDRRNHGAVIRGRRRHARDPAGVGLLRAAGIAASAKRLNLRSEASARGSNAASIRTASASGAARAIELLEQVASAKAADGAIDVYPHPISRPRISVRTARVNAILGPRSRRRGEGSPAAARHHDRRNR